MSNIIIEGKNLKNIDQSNFQSVGPYTNPNQTEVKEPWQGRYKLSGSQDTDLRFDLGTYTDNNRGFWEVQTTNPNTRTSQFESKDLQTARTKVVNGFALSDEVKWSVDTFPFSINENNETIPLYFYYDKDLHTDEYNTAVNGKVNLRIELREDGRNQNGIIDNFLERDAIRPFVLGLNINQYGTEADGELLGAGAFVVGDRVMIEANPNSLSYFEQWTGGRSSTSNPYYFDMPKEDLEVVGNFRPNPIVNIVPRGDGSTTTHEGAAMFWVGTQDELTNSYLDIGAGLGISIANDDYSYFETEFERQTLRPGNDLLILHKTIGDEYEFENYSYIGNDGEEVILEDEDPTDELIDKVGKIGRHNMLSQPEYPEGFLQIYANFSVLLFYVRSVNNWFLSEQNEQGLNNKKDFALRFGYGDGEPTFNASTMTGTSADGDGVDWFVMPLDSLLNMKIDKLLTNDIPGYGIGEWFWFQPPMDGELFNGFILNNNRQEFDDPILESLTDEDVGLDDGVTLSILANNSMESDVADQITGTKDAYTYIGYKFTQLGTYVKITIPENSHIFQIDNPDSTNVIRNKGLSPEIDANMYQLGANLQWEFTHNTVTAGGVIGAEPVIQSIVTWDNDNAAGYNQFPNSDLSIEEFLTTYNITYVQDGESMRLTYNPPGSIENNNYLKYLEFIVQSDIIPPPLDPFLGVFEIDFSSNSENLGTVSFLEQAPDIPQTTLIGLFGDDNSIETPTHAIDMDTWHDGDTTGIIPIPLDVNKTSPGGDTELTSLTVNLAPNFSSRVDQILDNSNFDNYDAGFKMAIKNSLINNYLNLQITDNNSLLIEPGNNEAVRTVLEFIEQNNDVPRLPLRISATFVREFTLTLTPTLVYNLNDGTSYPTKFITNWDQSAYNEDSSLGAADTWINDDLLEIDFDDMSEETFQITIPSAFFNGLREFKIVTAIDSDSDAVGGTELSFSGTSDPVLYTNQLTSYSHRHRIVSMDSSAGITLSYTTPEDTGGI